MIPNSMEAEQAVLASMIEDCSTITSVEFLNADDFFHRQHQEIYRIIRDEYNKGVSVDFFLMCDLVPDDCGGIAYLTDICKQNASTRNIVAYAKKVIDLSARRKTINAYQEAIEAISDSAIGYVEEVAKTSSEVDTQLSRLSTGDTLTVDELIDFSMDEMTRSSKTMRLGLSTGIEEIDDRLGYQHLAFGEVTYLGAQSKNGKTLFGNTITARCGLLEDECAHVFSIEMPAVGMFNGIVSAMSGVPSNFYARQDYYHKVYSDRFSEWHGKWGKSAKALRDSGKVTIDDRKDVTMQYICAEMRKQASLLENKGKKLKLVVIDHLHRISFDTSKKQMTYAMGDDVRMLKNTAADLGIAVLLLGQLNESCKDRDPTAFDILDTSRVRHEIQCFIGTRIFRDSKGTFFGIYSDAHRYADHETSFHPAYMQLIGGVVKTLPEQNKTWTPTASEE